MRRYAIGLATGVACAALAAGWLWAQPIVQNALTGNECWNSGQGPGGPSTGFICSYQTRASWGYLSNAAATTGTVRIFDLYRPFGRTHSRDSRGFPPFRT